MATKLKAVNALRPKLKLGRVAETDDVIERVVERTSTTDGEISIVVKEIRDALMFYLCEGRAVKIEGIGRFTPKIGLDGTLSVSFKLDKKVTNKMNHPDAFKGEIIRRENIGKVADELVLDWNIANPTDPVV